jgi:hypothetical protein
LLTGILADRVVHQLEVDRLKGWLEAAEPYRSVRPFSELADHIEHALTDGVLTIDECEDLQFLAQRCTTVNPHFAALRTGLQVLQGVITGVSADREIPENELLVLRNWIEDWSHLSGTWPYDECETLVHVALRRRDRVAIEQLMLMAQHFPIAGGGDDVQAPPLIGGVCAIDPVIQFAGHEFVFTGESTKGPRRSLEAHVHARGGATHDAVTKKANYLVVCDEGNPLWAFSCYGRKVEKAYLMRRGGHQIAIVHERDFWDALTE